MWKDKRCSRGGVAVAVISECAIAIIPGDLSSEFGTGKVQGAGVVRLHPPHSSITQLYLPFPWIRISEGVHKSQ